MRLFITFEGGEGAGKTTQIKLLAEHLRKSGRPVLTTREPGGTVIGDGIRRLLLDTNHQQMDSRAEALLYAASRAQLVREVIKPALAAGRIVICDRYVDSSIAYQVYGRGLQRQIIADFNYWATLNIMPDLTFLLLLPVADGLNRVSGTADRIEREAESFHAKVNAGYAALAREEPDRIKVINADRPIADIQTEIAALVEECIAKLPIDDY